MAMGVIYRYLWVFFYTNFLLIQFVQAESREELDNRFNKKDRNLPIENIRPLEANEPGFYSRKESGFGQEPIETFIAALAKKSSFYSNVIRLNFLCMEGEIPIPVPFKFKNIKWSISEGSTYDVKGGTAQTDKDGKLWLNFRSRGLVGGQTIKLNAGKKEINIELGRGPYEIILPMNFCKSEE